MKVLESLAVDVVLIYGIVRVALLCTFSILFTSRLKCGHCILEMWTGKGFV